MDVKQLLLHATCYPVNKLKTKGHYSETCWKGFAGDKIRAIKEKAPFNRIVLMLEPSQQIKELSRQISRMKFPS
jgi:hypothetical protein